jgi:hypothetical protein
MSLATRTIGNDKVFFLYYQSDKRRKEVKQKLERFILGTIIFFRSWWMSATVKTWPQRTLFWELYRFISQPIFGIFMAGKLSRSFDWINIIGEEKEKVLRYIQEDNLHASKMDVVTLKPEPSAPRRGKTRGMMIMAMLKWKMTALLLVPEHGYGNFRIGFMAEEERPLVLQYCDILFPAGTGVRVLKGPYTTSFFAIDINGNFIPLQNGGETDRIESVWLGYPLI